MKNILLIAIAATTLAACGSDEAPKRSLGDEESGMLPSPGGSTTATTTENSAGPSVSAMDEGGEVITNAVDPSAPNGGAGATSPAKGGMISTDFSKKSQ